MVFPALLRYMQDCTVKSLESEGYTDGEYTPVYATGISVRLAVFPLTPRDLKFLGEGQFTMQDMKFYEVGEGTITDKSEITFNDNKYLVNGGSNRFFHGGFTSYIGKRIDD
jgi:hypothetical protein